MPITLYNTMTRKREMLTPLEPGKVRMYVCGPTVYDRPHIGNARSVVVYDVLYRLLCHTYGEENITFVRNITDVDDKINARAKERGIAIQQLTGEVTRLFHTDMAALGCQRPTHEPRATEHIPQMLEMIGKLIDNGHAYVSQGHVLFDIASVPHYEPEMGNDVRGYVYGILSHRVQDDLHSGARVAVESYKKSDGDFVLWKPANEGDDASSVFDSPWGQGRPGWHIECSAMSGEYLGDSFDIHGGGADLMFPHHENEIAQSRCADKKAGFARMWVHNGFLTVDGEKMSKSLGNFITVRDLLDKHKGRAEFYGEVIRLCLLKVKYGEPLDWNEHLFDESKHNLERFYRLMFDMNVPDSIRGRDDATIWQNRYDNFLVAGAWHDDWITDEHRKLMDDFIYALSNDLNFSLAISKLHDMVKPPVLSEGELPATAEDPAHYFGSRVMMTRAAQLMGLLQCSEQEWKGGSDEHSTAHVEEMIAKRAEAKKNKDFAEADRIREQLKAEGILLEDKPGGKTEWRRE